MYILNSSEILPSEKIELLRITDPDESLKKLEEIASCWRERKEDQKKIMEKFEQNLLYGERKKD